MGSSTCSTSTGCSAQGLSRRGAGRWIDTPRERDFSAIVEDIAAPSRSGARARDGGRRGFRGAVALALPHRATSGTRCESATSARSSRSYEVTPIPCVPDFILGVVNVRGEILSVTDPARMMQLGIDRPDRSGRSRRPWSSPTAWWPPRSSSTRSATSSKSPTAPSSRRSASSTERRRSSSRDRCLSSDRMVGLLNVERMLEPIGA